MFFDLFWLIFAHYIGDVAFMNQWLFDFKSNSIFVTFAHSVIWGGCIAIALQYIGILTLWKILFLVIGHLIIDSLKSRYKYKKWAKPADEILHYCQIAIVYFIN